MQSLNVPAQTGSASSRPTSSACAPWRGNLGNRYVVANIPAAEVETVEDGVVAARHAAVVGKIDRPSPVLDAKILRSTSTRSGLSRLRS